MGDGIDARLADDALRMAIARRRPRRAACTTATTDRSMPRSSWERP